MQATNTHQEQFCQKVKRKFKQAGSIDIHGLRRVVEFLFDEHVIEVKINERECRFDILLRKEIRNEKDEAVQLNLIHVFLIEKWPKYWGLSFNIEILDSSKESFLK